MFEYNLNNLKFDFKKKPHQGLAIENKIYMMWLPRLGTRFYFTIKQTQSLFRISSCLRTYSCYLGKWEVPHGSETGITVYNSSVNEKVPLVLKNKGMATWYMCGPTVYDESHIGHACCYVKFDIIRRIMENVFGINVLLLMGITDIDDKIIKKSLECNLSTSAISRKYELTFFEDMSSMRVIPPSAVCRVTDHISHIISFIEKLIEKEFAYVTDKGSVYFVVAKGVSAEILSEISTDSDMNIDPLKKDKRDFALWKAAKENEPYWVSPWGKGRPGWHIECSAMASSIFGSHLDLHSGGYDLLFPHHSNEKSQSEAYHNCPQWGNYWMHSGLLQVGDEIKMSKSIKNTIPIKEFLQDNSVNDFRILCLQSLYRKNILYTSEILAGAKGLHEKFHNFINEMELYSSGELIAPLIDENNLLSKLRNTEEHIVTLLADDFNTSQAILSLVELIDVVNESLQSATPIATISNNGATAISACANYIDKILEMLGVKIMCKRKLDREFVLFMNAVTDFRIQIRLFALYQNGKDLKPVCYIENAYASYLTSYQLFNSSEKSSSSDIHLINVQVNLIYEKCAKFAREIQNSNTDGPVSTAEIKKKRLKFLVFCDELRSALETYKVSIKDRKGTSTWCLKL